VEARKTILIVTDGAEQVVFLAEQIAAAAQGVRALILTAPEFAGTHVLPADGCFFGCEKPRPPSFAHLEDVLHHINLAGRPCGLFSSDSQEAIAYLADMVRDSELALNPEPLFFSDREKITRWVGDLIRETAKN
jgi:hypothetical protein